MDISLGIDFGTTNTAAALNIGGTVTVLSLGNGTKKERTLRSIMFITPDGDVFFGQKALEMYLASEPPARMDSGASQFATVDDKGGLRIWEEGLAAYVAQQPKRGRVMQSFKSFLSSETFSGVMLHGKRCSIEELIAVLLRYVKERAEEHAGGRIDAVTLGRPVVFSEDPARDRLAEKRLIAAAHAAGFTDVTLQKEPIAACLSYIGQLKTGDTRQVLVGDFGGGTSDFTVVRLTRSDTNDSFQVKATGGVYIGGDTFNSRVMREVVAPYFGKNVTHEVSSSQKGHFPYWLTAGLCEWHKLPFMNTRTTLATIEKIRMTADDTAALDRLRYLITSNKGYYVHDAINTAKVELSTREDTTIVYDDSVLLLHEQLSRTIFNGLIAHDVDVLERCITQTLNDAHVEPAQLDGILLTGGTAFVPAVRDIFTHLFPAIPIIQLDAFTSVAAGLAASRFVSDETMAGQ